MKLPERFQFRVDHSPGHTHNAKRKEDSYEIKWARGWDRHLWDNHPDEDTEAEPCVKEMRDYYVEGFVNDGSWIIVDQPEAKQEGTLPDEFTLETECFGSKFQCTRTKGGFNFVNERGATTLDSPISEKFILDAIQDGAWEIVGKQPLTAEQQRANKEFREQIAALEQSIKLNQQDIEHKQILINSYEERKAFLLSKIVGEI